MKRNFYYGAAIYFIQNITDWHMPLGISLGTIQDTQVMLGDTTAVASFVFAASHSKSMRRAYPLQWNLFLVFAALVGVSLIRGVLSFGPSSPINEARYVIYFLGCVCWYATSRAIPGYLDLSKWRNFALTGSVITLAFEIYNLLTYGLGSASEFIYIDPNTSHNSRALMPVQAMFLLMTLTIFLTTTSFPSRYPRFTKYVFPGLLLAGILLAQQRSVWVATLTTLASFLLFKRTRRITLIFVFVALLAFAIFLELGTFFEPIARSIRESANNTSTFFAREGSWVQYLDNFANYDFFNQAFGQPFGSGWGRYDGLNHIWVEFNPHNWYVIVLLRTGVMGLGVLVSWYLTSVVKSFSRRGSNVPYAFVQVQQLAYQIFYPIPWQSPLPYMAPEDAGASDAAHGSQNDRKELAQKRTA